MNTLNWRQLRKFVRDRKPVEVSAGLLEDWHATAAPVYEGGKYIKDHSAHLQSTWATAGFKATMKNGDTIEVEANKVT